MGVPGEPEGVAADQTRQSCPVGQYQKCLVGLGFDQVGLDVGAGQPFDDPAAAGGSEEARLDTFRKVRDQIDERIKSWLATMAAT